MGSTWRGDIWDAMVARTWSGKVWKKLSFLKSGTLMARAISFLSPKGSSVITWTSSPASAPYSQSFRTHMAPLIMFKDTMKGIDWQISDLQKHWCTSSYHKIHQKMKWVSLHMWNSFSFSTWKIVLIALKNGEATNCLSLILNKFSIAAELMSEHIEFFCEKRNTKKAWARYCWQISKYFKCLSSQWALCRWHCGLISRTMSPAYLSIIICDAIA